MNEDIKKNIQTFRKHPFLYIFWVLFFLTGTVVFLALPSGWLVLILFHLINNSWGIFGKIVLFFIAFLYVDFTLNFPSLIINSFFSEY